MQGAVRAERAVAHAHGPQARRPSGRADRVWLGLLLALPIAVTVWGLSYYAAPAADRVRSSLHPLLRSSGLVGQTLGITGLLFFLSMWLYPVRKHVRWLAGTGSMSSWMRVHTVIGLSLPLLIAVHASWHFRGLIGLGYLAMMLVCASGLVGRYLYVRIPRARNGVELSRDEVSGQRRALITEIAAALELDPADVEEELAEALAAVGGSGAGSVLRRLVADDFVRWRALRALRRKWSAPRLGKEPVAPGTVDRMLRLARRELALAQQLRVLEGTQRLLRYWHVAHRPVAITALLAVLVHVGVAIALGQTWLR